MKTATFFVFCLVCGTSPLSVAADEASVIGQLSNWWSPPLESPKEPVGKPVEKMPNPGGNNAPGETLWTLLNKLKDQTLGHAAKYVPDSEIASDLGDFAAKKREEAKEKARRELCELIKACVKSTFWFWG